MSRPFSISFSLFTSTSTKNPERTTPLSHPASLYYAPCLGSSAFLRALRHPRNHARSALHVVAHLHRNRRALWQPKIHPRPKPHQPNQFAASHRISRLLPRHHPPRHPSGNLLEHNLPVFARQRKNILFIFQRSLLRPRRQKFPRLILQPRKFLAAWAEKASLENEQNVFTL